TLFVWRRLTWTWRTCRSLTARTCVSISCRSVPALSRRRPQKSHRSEAAASLERSTAFMAHEISREAATSYQDRYERLRKEIGKRIVGYRDVVDQVLTAMFAGGHVLLEGVPGLGKTLLVRTVSEATQLSFQRIQFTPDLMPADITGTNIIHDDQHGGREFRFQPGPIFANLVLADEINRATPRTQ